MSTIMSDQAFYALTIHPPTQPTMATTFQVMGSTRTEQQIVEAVGSRIIIREVNKDRETDVVTLDTIIDEDVFGIVRAIAPMRIPATEQDQLIVATDSGKLIAITYDPVKKKFDRTFMESYGKSGIRRQVPGQYLAVDPRGRCCMLASVEKNKVVYLAQRMPSGELTISSPKEANQFGLLCHATCALFTDWDNPCFAALEMDYTEYETAEANTGDNAAFSQRKMMLTYYTVEINLSSVVKSWTVDVDESANKLFPVPGSDYGGPSGVIVCAEDTIYWFHESYAPISIRIPQRQNEYGLKTGFGPGRLIVSGCSHAMKGRNFFFLLQTDEGDTYKLTMDLEEDENGRKTQQVKQLNLVYYETFPVARSMVLLRKGYLYIAAENGNSKLYHVDSLADDDDEPFNQWSHDAPMPFDEQKQVVKVRKELLYTTLKAELPSMHPLIKTHVENVGNVQDAPSIYSLSGLNDDSSFNVTRHGLDITTEANNPVGSAPYDGLWSLKANVSDELHSWLIMSSNWSEVTTILRITDSVETADDTEFLATRRTVFAQLMNQDVMVQVHPRAIRQIRASGEVIEWPVPKNRTIAVASGNETQLLLGLSTGELAFFFMGGDDALNAMEEMPDLERKITAISVQRLRRGEAQSKYAAVGCDDSTIRIYSITADNPLEQLSVQALSAPPTSIEIQEIAEDSGVGTVLVVHIGLESGLYLRAALDETTGELGDVRTRFVGSRKTELYPVQVKGQDCLFASSSRPWLGYNHPNSSMYTLTPLITDPVKAACTFLSEEIRGICAIQEGNLHIFTVDDLTGRLSTQSAPLHYTPRALARNPWYNVFYVAQSSGNTPSLASRKEKILAHPMWPENEVVKDPAHFDGPGLPRWQGHWASCITAIDPISYTEIEEASNHEFGNNEAALCCVCVQFESKGEDVYLAVGTGQNMQQESDDLPVSGHIHIFRLLSNGEELEYVHNTQFDHPIHAILPYKGRLAVGNGNELLIYDLGMKALLRKSRAAVVQNQIVSLSAFGDRIVAGDVSDGVTYVLFKTKHNRLIPFSDDVCQRWTTTTTMVDYETTAGADKFGNLWLVRPSEQASKEAAEEGVGGFIQNERSYLGGTPYRSELKAHFYTQDIAMSLQRTSLVAGGQEVLFWSGLQGTMGMLVPFIAREDLEFFTALESLLRQHTAGFNTSLIGRDHMAFRSYYVPVKGVVDGDLCEKFITLARDIKALIAAELDRHVREIEKKITEMRTRVAF